MDPKKYIFDNSLTRATVGRFPPLLSNELLLISRPNPKQVRSLLSARSCALRGDFAETCAASSNAKLHDALVGSANGDRYEHRYHVKPSCLFRDGARRLPYVLLLLLLLSDPAQEEQLITSQHRRMPAQLRQQRRHAQIIRYRGRRRPGRIDHP